MLGDVAHKLQKYNISQGNKKTGFQLLKSIKSCCLLQNFIFYTGLIATLLVSATILWCWW